MKADSSAVVTCAGVTKIYQTGTVALDNLTLTIVGVYIIGLALIAGKWFKSRELLLYNFVHRVECFMEREC